MYQQSRTAIFSNRTIQSSFHGTGLIPFNPDRVLSMLIQTPSPPTSSHGQNSSPWTSETPKNLVELAKQTQLVHQSLQLQSRSPIEPLAKVLKGCQLAMAGAALLDQENKELRATIKHLERKKQRSRTQLQHGGIL